MPPSKPRDREAAPVDRRFKPRDREAVLGASHATQTSDRAEERGADQRVARAVQTSRFCVPQTRPSVTLSKLTIVVERGNPLLRTSQGRKSLEHAGPYSRSPGES